MGLQSDLIPLLAVLVSLFAIPLIALSSRRPNLRESWTFLAALIKFGLVLSLIPGALRGETVGGALFDIAPGLPFELEADPLGVFFALIASGLWIFTSAYSIGYMRGNGEVKQTRFFAAFAMSLSSTIGVAFAGNLFTFIVFYEILTLSTYPLVVHKESDAAIQAARKYLTYTLTAGLLLVAGAGLLYMETGTLDFEAGGLSALIDSDIASGKLWVIFILMFIGVGVKAGVMPLHSWLPSAMAAPTPVSSLLHAVAVVKSGVFGVLRVSGFIFGFGVLQQMGADVLMMILSAFTLTVASFLAFKQDNLKRRLAYSTVGHLSYIVLGVSLMTMSGVLGSVLHIAAHATMKITLFFCAGAIYVNLHKDSISQLDGAAKVMPWTFAAFTIGAMGLTGIPPINGFFSKWTLALGTIEAGQWIPLGLLILSGLMNAGYFFPIVARAYFKPGGKDLEGHGEANPWMVVPLVSTAMLSVIFGLFPNAFVHILDLATVIMEQLFNVGGDL
ncbi:MAG: monovalent cation/H+ antiporter subunit D family protein [Bacteroidetes bacterium]|nr:monovalent cation/H+ antiporter subunit D family protein [Bacteroidota bacterium]